MKLNDKYNTTIALRKICYATITKNVLVIRFDHDMMVNFEYAENSYDLLAADYDRITDWIHKKDQDDIKGTYAKTNS